MSLPTIKHARIRELHASPVAILYRKTAIWPVLDSLATSVTLALIADAHFSSVKSIPATAKTPRS